MINEPSLKIAAIQTQGTEWKMKLNENANEYYQNSVHIFSKHRVSGFEQSLVD